MGLMDLFKKKEPVTADAPTAVDYVDWLFQYMLGISKMTLTIDTRRALPGHGPLSGNSTPPPCLPEAAIVLNRLKILAGVNPVKQSRPIEGTFERPRKHLTVITHCRFQDFDEYSTCAIELVVKGLNTVGLNT